jgi:hypothetical protein
MEENLLGGSLRLTEAEFEELAGVPQLAFTR